jgi:hypothetical protein
MTEDQFLEVNSEQKPMVSTSVSLSAKPNVMRCDNIASKLNELYPSGLILGECQAIVGDFGLIVEWNSKDNKKYQKKFLPDEKIYIVEIRGDVLFLGGYVPRIQVHAERFKGFVRRIA